MIEDNFLTNVAKALNGESFVVPAYFAIGTTDMSPLLGTETAVSGEIGTREEMVSSRSGNVTEYVATRSASDVVDTASGDDIKTIASLSAETGGDLMTALSVSGIIQTTTFDYEFILTVETNRR